MLNILEELFLLALNDEKGTIPHSIAIPFRFALGGAVLAELFLADKIKLNAHQKVVLLDHTPCGDPILDETLRVLEASHSHHKIPYWINEINPKPKKLLKHLGESLVNRGILKQEEKRYLWVIPYMVFPQQDASAKYWVKQHLRGVVLAGEVADLHTAMVLCLVRAGYMLDFVFTRDEMKTAQKRVARITKNALFGQEVNEAVAEIENAVNALIVSAMTA